MKYMFTLLVKYYLGGGDSLSPLLSQPDRCCKVVDENDKPLFCNGANDNALMR